MNLLLKYLITAAVGAVPVIEIRGAIPIGVGMGLGPLEAYIAAAIGNCIPIPLIVLFARPVFDYLKKTKALSGFAEWMERRTMKKAADITKYEQLGLFIFVAIPLPGTGAWTGALIAALLGMKVKDSFSPIALGVLAAGLIVLIITYGFVSLINLI